MAAGPSVLKLNHIGKNRVPFKNGKYLNNIRELSPANKTKSMMAVKTSRDDHVN